MKKGIDSGEGKLQRNTAARKKLQAEKKAAQAAKKVAREELQRDKEAVYTMRKNTLMKLLRLVLWAMITVIFLRGVISALRPDPTAEVNQTIADFRAELADYNNQDSEIMAFAEGFAVEYFTYSADVADYTARLNRYAASGLQSNAKKPPTGSTAKVVYAQAYRLEPYSQTQTDVWVFLRVEYTSKDQSADGVTSQVVKTEETMVKVPVCKQNGYYIVEDGPVFVNDSTKIKDFAAEPENATGSEISREEAAAVKEALTNFYVAYYGEPQSVINYYLDTTAEPADFIGLSGRIKFKEITALRVFYKTDEDTEHYVATVTVMVEDSNGVNLPQNYNLSLTYRDKQYYICTMDARGTK